MPIGATVGAAVVGAGASIYTGSKAASAQKKATEQAAASQNAGMAEAARINAEVAGKNNAFAEHMYNRNEAWLSPTIIGGYAAGDQIMGLLLGTGANAGKEGYASNGWYPSVAPKPVSTTPGAPGGPAAPTAAQSLDAWYTGAVNAMLPNITQPDNIAKINSAATPEAKFNAAMSFSPASSDQYALYQAYAQANPKPAAPAPAPAAATPAPTGTPATNAVVSQQPLPTNAVAAVAPTLPAGNAPLARANLGATTATNAVAAVAPTSPAPAYPKMSDYIVDGKIDSDAYRAARTAHDAAVGFSPTGSNGWQGQSPTGRAAPRIGPNAVQPVAPGTATPPTAAPGTAAPPAAAPNNAVAAADAWETWKNSTHYQNRLNAGLDGVATKYAAHGAFESGAEKKAINDYAQVFASNELGAYMDRLYQQQALGASSASSLAGVGTNLVAQVSNNNSDAANAAAAAAAGGGVANGNAILAAGQSSASQWGNVGNAIGTAAGGVAAAFQPKPNYVAGYGGGWSPPPGYGGIYDDIYSTY